MKIKIESTKTVVTHKEIELPYYSKSICHFYKVYSEKHCISVTDLTEHESICNQDSSLAFGSGNKKSNEAEFKKAFDRISKILISKI